MALADISVFMIRATYMDNMAESRWGRRDGRKRGPPRFGANSVSVFLSRITDIRMDVAVPEAGGSRAALEVEQCACPQGYRGPSCQVRLGLRSPSGASCDSLTWSSCVATGLRRRLHALQLRPLPGHLRALRLPRPRQPLRPGDRQLSGRSTPPPSCFDVCAGIRLWAAGGSPACGNTFAGSDVPGISPLCSSSVSLTKSNVSTTPPGQDVSAVCPVTMATRPPAAPRPASHAPVQEQPPATSKSLTLLLFRLTSTLNTLIVRRRERLDADWSSSGAVASRSSSVGTMTMSLTGSSPSQILLHLLPGHRRSAHLRRLSSWIRWPTL